MAVRVAGTCVWLGVADVRTCGELFLVSTSAFIAGRIRKLELVKVMILPQLDMFDGMRKLRSK